MIERCAVKLSNVSWVTELIAVEPEFQTAKKAFDDFKYKDPGCPTREEKDLSNKIDARFCRLRASRMRLLQQVKHYLSSKGVAYGDAFTYKGYVITYNNSGVQVFNQISVE
jgi:hypothetical protein